MACSLLGIVVAAVALPRSVDGAVDAQVAWDLIDLPFSIDESLLGELLAHPAEDSTPIKLDLGLLDSKFKRNLKIASVQNLTSLWGADSSDADGPKQIKWQPRLRGGGKLKPARPLGGIRRKPLVWVHLHKAGGHLMCNMAKLNENVVRPETNCNWEGHDGWKQSGQPSVRKSCSERAQMFHEFGYTYGQIEREISDEEVCDQFRYGIMFREPLALMQSTLNYELWFQTRGESKGRRLPEKGGQGAPPVLAPPTKPPPKKERSIYSQPFLEFPSDVSEWLKGKIEAEAVPGNERVPWVWLDNFQTRFLANAFDVPAGQITRDHLARARAFLQRNDFTVQVLEDLPEQGENLFKKLGWTWYKGAFKKKTHSFKKLLKNNPSYKAEHRDFTPEEQDYLRRLNQYDVELYNGARDPLFVLPAEHPAEQ